ncbi:MAG TPA: macro domain-containing protein [Gaiellaceae bacterium]
MSLTPVNAYKRIELALGDITKERVDAIVNAANSGLRGGGGVDGAIHRAAGIEIIKECRRIGYCAAGEAVITGAGKLSARFLIHAVGPIWQGGNRGEPLLLASCHERALELARTHRCSTVAFPAISTGAYGYPPELAAAVALARTIETLERLPMIDRVRFVFIDERLLEIYEHAFTQLRPSNPKFRLLRDDQLSEIAQSDLGDAALRPAQVSERDPSGTR